MGVIENTNHLDLSEDQIIETSLSSGITNGIYFLIQTDRIIYVGTARNCERRIRTHMKNTQKQFNRTFILPVDIFDEYGTSRLEKHYIRKFKPIFNKRSNPDFIKGKNRVWYSYITNFDSYEKLSKEVGVDPYRCRSIIKGIVKRKDEDYYILTEYLKSISKQPQGKTLDIIANELGKEWEIKIELK